MNIGMTTGIGLDNTGEGCAGADRALRHQLLALERVADRLIHARAVLPPAAGGGVWTGDARRMYVLALRQLSAQVHSAGAHVEDAIRDTQHALASLPGGSHGG